MKSEVNVGVRLLFCEERQGSSQLRADVSGRDAERVPKQRYIFSQERRSASYMCVNRRVERGGRTEVFVGSVKGGWVSLVAVVCGRVSGWQDLR